MLKCGGRFHCAGIAFCEIRTFLRSHWDWHLESGVFGVLDVAVTLGFASGCCIEAVFSRQVSAQVAALVDGGVLRTCQNHSERVVWCKFC